MKYYALLFSFFASASICAQTLSPEMIAGMEHESTPTERALRNIVSANAIKSLVTNNTYRPLTNDFTDEIKSRGISDQKQSGRCWMFTGLNVLRQRMITRLNQPFMFSQNHLFFYDQLEKSNLFLQTIIDTRSLPLTDRKIDWMLNNPLSDGGTYTGVADLIAKYGLVPASVKPETYNTDNTDAVTRYIKRVLRQTAIELRENKAPVKELIKRKEEVLAQIHHILTLAFGTPVKSFTWAPDSAKTDVKEYTPLQFAEMVLDGDNLIDNYVMIMHDPTREYYKMYDIDMDRHVYEGHNWVYLNLPIDEVKQACINSIKGGDMMYFSCDVGKELNSATGMLDLNNYAYDDLFGCNVTMNKAQRIKSHDSGSSHAMTLMAVNLDKDGKPTKWKVENSWGAGSGVGGHLIMSDRWFEEYMFRVVVNRKYLTDKQNKLATQKPVQLPCWDYMF